MYIYTQIQVYIFKFNLTEDQNHRKINSKINDINQYLSNKIPPPHSGYIPRQPTDA